MVMSKAFARKLLRVKESKLTLEHDASDKNYEEKKSLKNYKSKSKKLLRNKKMEQSFNQT